MYIMPAGSSRLFIGDSSAQIYSINFAGVQSFESFPAIVAMQVSNNAYSFGTGTNAVIASSGNKNLMFTTASGTSSVYISTSGNPSTSMRAFPFLTYGNNTDSYNWTSSHYYYNTYFNATSSSASFPYHTRWSSAGTQLGGIDMGGNLNMTGNITTSGVYKVGASTGLTGNYLINGSTSQCWMNYTGGILTASSC
jgi:hypothetical protein